MDPLPPPSSDAARRPPAPGRLELLRTFLNTVDLESGDDEFSSAERLSTWLIERNLLSRGTTLAQSDLSAAITFRETLRDVLETNAGHLETAGAAARLDQIAAGVPLRLQIGASVRLEPEQTSGIEPAIGRFLAIIYESVTQGTWQRMKVCRSDTCRWAFYDSSRNRSGAWCTMAICGNRMKGRTFRGRRPTRARAT